ncbi:MAG: OmpA family protein [Steroidobacteraceae bacterium]
MIRYSHLGSAAVVAALMLGGCVTQDTYDQLQAEKNQEVAALQTQRATLEQQIQELRTQRSTLEGERNSLEQQKGSLEQQKTSLEQDKASLERAQAELRRQNEALEAQKSQLLSASKQSQAQYDSLVAGLNQEVQKVFPSNWELSAARSTTVVRFLQEAGIAPERLIATGRAEYAPVAPNDSPEGRQKNRRIEITLIDRNLLQ